MASSYGSGLICGFRLAGPSACDEQADSVESSPRWLHFKLSDSRAREWLKGQTELPDDARDTLLNADPRIHLEVLPGGITAVLGDLFHDFDDDPERLGTLRLYLDRRVMLSGRTHPLKAADVLRREFSHGHEPTTTLGLFQLLIERLADSIGQVVRKLNDQVDSAEDRILDGKHSGQGTRSVT